MPAFAGKLDDSNAAKEKLGALKKEVMEKVPWIAPAAGTLYGCVWYAQDYKRKEDMHHRF